MSTLVSTEVRTALGSGKDITLVLETTDKDQHISNIEYVRLIYQIVYQRYSPGGKIGYLFFRVKAGDNGSRLSELAALPSVKMLRISNSYNVD